jgi:hypothetical protein
MVPLEQSGRTWEEHTHTTAAGTNFGESF